MSHVGHVSGVSKTCVTWRSCRLRAVACDPAHVLTLGVGYAHRSGRPPLSPPRLTSKSRTFCRWRWHARVWYTHCTSEEHSKLSVADVVKMSGRTLVNNDLPAPGRREG
ncbi:hypothetical protein EVAR_3192_1 [Eumeta japonica]|uniref:Uncharacterized protein n=1 Tax=Eumeta variegata TaxID=151549 RepID=A0A4C1SVC8_EUMVA|nr:hypothetical protein EVAR_3192_1 [Eumeta japonica]